MGVLVNKLGTSSLTNLCGLGMAEGELGTAEVE